MTYTQFTLKYLQDNYTYVTKLVDYDKDHLNWNPKYPLTALQCEKSMVSSDMMEGWLRKGKGGVLFL